MKEMYWEQFIATGRVEDYLSYKMCKMEERSASKTCCDREEKEGNKCESDRIDRNGIIYSTGGRI